MKKILFLLLLTCLLFSCAEKSSKKEINHNSKITNSQIIDTTLINNEGIPLNLIFNNTEETLIIKFNNEVFELKKVRTGSGVQYSNSNLIYNNWHGITTLKKDGELIFEHKNPSN